MNLPPSNRRAGQDRAAYEHVASQLCVIYYAELGRNSRLVPTLVVVGDIISFPVPATTSTMQMYVILFFLGVSLFQDLIFFQDSDMSSYIGFHCYKISSLFEDLASMNKTLSISVGLNSHARMDKMCKLCQRESESQHNNTHRLFLSPSAAMVKLGRRTKPTFDISHRKGRYRPPRPQFGWNLLVWENSSAFPRLRRGRDYRSKAERHRTTSRKAQKLRIRQDCERKAKATCSR
jgi:hypothetical protein